MSYVPKINRSVAPLSSFHDDAIICDDTDNLEIIEHYNKIKSVVDISDQMCAI